MSGLVHSSFSRRPGVVLEATARQSFPSGLAPRQLYMPTLLEGDSLARAAVGLANLGHKEGIRCYECLPVRTLCWQQFANSVGLLDVDEGEAVTMSAP